MTIRTEFPVNALPGKIVFTPGGRYGVMINQTPATGSAVISIELPTGIIAVASPTVPVILNTLTVASAGRIYATSNQTRALYEILVEPLRIRTATFPNIASPTNVGAVATTNEWLNPNYVLVATSNSVLRLNYCF